MNGSTRFIKISAGSPHQKAQYCLFHSCFRSLVLVIAPAENSLARSIRSLSVISNETLSVALPMVGPLVLYAPKHPSPSRSPASQILASRSVTTKTSGALPPAYEASPLEHYRLPCPTEGEHWRPRGTGADVANVRHLCLDLLLQYLHYTQS